MPVYQEAGNFFQLYFSPFHIYYIKRRQPDRNLYVLTGKVLLLRSKLPSAYGCYETLKLANLRRASLDEDTLPDTPSPTFLDAVLQVVDDGCQDSGETHDLSTLGQAEGEELVPAGPHQAGVTVLPGDTEVRVGVVDVGISPSPSMPKQVDSASVY